MSVINHNELSLHGVLNPPQPKPNIYQRPSDWLSMPSVSAGDVKGVALVAVYNSDSNFCSVTANGSGTYQVDWGDGTVDTGVSGGTACKHVYLYSYFSSQSATSRGYKQAIVTVTPTAGKTLTTLTFNSAYGTAPASTRITPYLDIIVCGAALTTVSVTGIYTLERITIIDNALTAFSLGTNLISLGYANIKVTTACTTLASVFLNAGALQTVIISGNFSNVTSTKQMFQSCNGLTQVPFFDTSNVTNFSLMFYNCSQLTSVPLYDSSNASNTNMSQMFYGCLALTSVPLFVTTHVNNFSSMFYNCLAMVTAPLLDTSAATDMSDMFYNCVSLRNIPSLSTGLNQNCYQMFYQCMSLPTIPTIDTHSSTNFQEMFRGCRSITNVPSLTTTSGTNFIGMFYQCYALENVGTINVAACSSAANIANVVYQCYSLDSCGLTGGVYAISLSGCNLSEGGLVSFFNGLGTASGSQTITTTNNWGSNGFTCTGTVSSSSPTITGITARNTNGCYAGASISGTYITAGSVVSSWTETTITMNQNGSGNGSSTVTVGALTTTEKAICTNKGYTLTT